MTTKTRASILIAGLAGMACLSTSASAQAPADAASSCPARYEAMDGHCYDKISGDIVLAEGHVAPRILTSGNCRAGYMILFDTFCYSNVTGDIELPDNTPRIAFQATGNRR